MRLRIYNFLVNRHCGIRSRYHKMHDNSGLLGRRLSWFYLLWLNFCYYAMFCRFLDYDSEMAIYEEKKLLIDKSESKIRIQEGFSIGEVVAQLSQYDVISFDIFDTLLLRPFSEPTDLFHFLGPELGLLDIKRIRIEQEAIARKLCWQRNGHYEVTLQDIWNQIERETGIPAERGMQIEQSLEWKFCYANPFMLEVFRRLQEKGKVILAVSDMYLSGKFLKELLEKNGYTNIAGLYVSCEWGCNKGNGGLFEQVNLDRYEEKKLKGERLKRKRVKGKRLKEKELKGKKLKGEKLKRDRRKRHELKDGMQKIERLIHVGDNEHSDVKMAVKSGFDVLYYPNVNKKAEKLRAHDMSPVIGSAYRGIIDNHLYSGLHLYSIEYEYGFIYGGLFVVGYCNFIHNYCHTHQIDRILFLSRDGDILKQVYDRMFPEDSTTYVYWSRSAAVKLMAEHDRYDFFRRFLYHKVNQGISLESILESMELQQLSEHMKKYVDKDAQGKETGIDLINDESLTNGNVETLKRFLLTHFQEIIDTYRVQDIAAKQYFKEELAGAGSVAAVDIGWAGSGALALDYLVNRVWNLSCKITGIVAGTNTLHNAEPEASEIYIQSGKLVPYLFSQAHNRDVMKKHDLNRDYNIFWELLLSSPTRQFLGFGLDGQGKVELHFGERDINLDGIRDIQRGILDFAECYLEHFGDFPFMFDISGRDAYAPMLLASSHKEKYLRAMAAKFDLMIGI